MDEKPAVEQLQNDTLLFNGVDLDTGSYLFPTTSVRAVATVARGGEPEPGHLSDLQARRQADTEDHLGVIYGRDPARLKEVGWGVVAADDVGPEVLEALAPLCQRRREQAGDLYRELTGSEDGVHPGDGKQDFLIRHKVATLDVVDPRELPYYLMLIGSPDRLSFSLQYQLDVQYGVGRVHFDTPEEYAQYAQNVLAAETGAPPAETHCATAHVFATRNRGDLPTALSSSRLAAPLVRDLGTRRDVGSDIGDGATKPRLAELLNGGARTDLLFTATHGLGTAGSLQRRKQGALVCQEWTDSSPGSLAGGAKKLAHENYFSADDLDFDRPLSASVVFSFACYSAGTPHDTDFVDSPSPAATADPPFLARLPQALLSHPKGGCLAFVGHVDRAWNCSFLWKGVEPRILPFSSSMGALLDGYPLGMAMEYVSARYATSATELVDLLHNERLGLRLGDRELARLWLATNDARNFLVVGDPAVRLTTSAATG